MHPLFSIRLACLSVMSHPPLSRVLPPPTQSTAVSEFCRDKSNAGLSESTVAAYIWNVRHDKASSKKVTKFVEALWRFLFYSYFCYLGYRALFTPTTASWVQDTAEHWRGWPMQPVPAAVRFYYNIELGAYLHQLMWTEVSRSDSLEMIVHHLVTSALITFSYLTSFTRIGASILLLHDSADIFLESAKVCYNVFTCVYVCAAAVSFTCLVAEIPPSHLTPQTHLTRTQPTAQVVNYISKASGNGRLSVYCDGLFAAFALTFFVTRLVLYPRYLVYSLLYEAPAILGGTWPGYWVFATLLVVLQLLHVFWFYLIMRMIVGLLSQGNVEKDVRSDDEADLADDHDPSAKNSSGGGSGSSSSPPKKIATKKSKKADESVGSGGGADAAGTSSSGSRAKNGGDSKKGSESKKAASSSSSSSSGDGADRLLRSSKKSKG